MNRDDPLGRAIRELDHVELVHLLESCRPLVVRATPRVSAFYLAVSAHLMVEVKRRNALWAQVALGLSEDQLAGEQVLDLDASIEEARRELCEEG